MLTEHDDEMRFNEINVAVPDVSRTGLSYAIARMMEDGLLERRQYSNHKQRFAYSLTLEGYGVGHMIINIKKALEKAKPRG